MGSLPVLKLKPVVGLLAAAVAAEPNSPVPTAFPSLSLSQPSLATESMSVSFTGVDATAAISHTSYAR